MSAPYVDERLLDDIRRLGATDVSACFSCGNCTAVCPLADEGGAFPRRLIRYAQLGMKDALLSSKELWTCYHCGVCSDTCPTQADPGGFMAAARRYAITSYDRTRLAWLMYTRPVLASAVGLFVAAFFALFLYASHGPQNRAAVRFFQFIPEPLIHDTGIAVIVLMLLAGVAGIATMARAVGRQEGQSALADLADVDAVAQGTTSGHASPVGVGQALWTALAVESLGQRRYRADCAEAQVADPWYRRRWLLHAATMWGFLGLLAASVLDYGLAIVGVKATGSWVPLWYPVRLLGTLSGLALLYGVGMFLYDRAKGRTQAARHSEPADWAFLVLLAVTALTGFAIELSLYLPHAPAWAYWLFLVHVSVAMELVLLVPFTKFAHVLYRPVALYFWARRQRAQAVHDADRAA